MNGSSLIESPAAATITIARSGFGRPWLWLNFLCLDAPIVALAWQWLFARAFGVQLNAGSRAALFLTAWLIYLADRLADTFSLDPTRPASLRHRFCLRHRFFCIVLIAIVIVLDAWVVWQFLETRVLVLGAIVGSFAFLYLTTNYTVSRIWRTLPVKEIAIGFLFAFGTLTALARSEIITREFAGAALLFAVLCSLNCIFIAAWERQIDLAQRRESIATSWPNLARYLRTMAVVLALVSLAFGRWNRDLASLTNCIAISALLLAALDLLTAWIRTDDRTALADIVLLTPLFVVLW